MQDILREIFHSISSLTFLEILGLILGVVSSILLIKNKIITWPFGIGLVIISLVIFWRVALYGDVILQVVFFVLYSFGWYEWAYGSNREADQYPITFSSAKLMGLLIGITGAGVLLFAKFLIWVPSQFDGMAPASLPYWDSLTTILSFTAIYLTAKKKIESWYYWLIANVLYTGIYFYKDLYYYSLLYFIYIAFAIWGYLSWKKIMSTQ